MSWDESGWLAGVVTLDGEGGEVRGNGGEEMCGGAGRL